MMRTLSLPRPWHRAIWRLSVHQAAMALVPIGAFAVAWVQPVDSDYWWHRATGELIVRTHNVPRTDPFSFTSQGTAWTDHEWLAQVFMYGIDATAGYAALFLALTGLGLVAWYLVYRFLRDGGIAPLPALAVSIAPATFGAMYWRARPAMFSVFFLALFLTELSRARDGRRRLWLLPVLMVIWANLHGGYVLGLLLIAMFAAAQWIDRRQSGATDWRHAAAILLVSFVATGINPYTHELWTYPLSYFHGNNESVRVLDEWQAPDFHELRNAPLAVLLVVSVTVGAWTTRFDAWRVLVLACFAALALHSMRHQPLFAIAWATVAGPTLAERLPWMRRHETHGGGIASINWALLCGAVAALLTIAYMSPQGLALRHATTGGSMPYPVAAADYLEQQPPGARVFNEYTWGGYLIDRLYPRHQVFIDGRADVHGSLLSEYVDAMRGEGWRDLFDRYDVEFALLPRGSRLEAQLAQAGWRTVVEDRAQILLASPAHGEGPSP